MCQQQGGGRIDLHTGVDDSELEQMVHKYLGQAIAPSTLRTYNSGKVRFCRFCKHYNYPILPVSEDIILLCKYVAFIGNQGLKHGMTKTYLSAIRHMQIMSGYGDPFGVQMPCLEYVMRDIKCAEAKKGGRNTRIRLPITPKLLRDMKAGLMKDPHSHDNTMIWVACCTCFFGFLRLGEIVVPSSMGYDPSVHLSVGNVTLDSRVSPSVAQVTVKVSKTDPFRKGVAIFLGKTNNELCPVTALATYMYLAVRGATRGSFFRFVNGRPLTRESFVSRVRNLK